MIEGGKKKKAKNFQLLYSLKERERGRNEDTQHYIVVNKTVYRYINSEFFQEKYGHISKFWAEIYGLVSLLSI
jgi:hypothetical protein